MRCLRYLALLSILILPAAYSHAQVSIGIGVGPAYGYYAPPACAYGYYGYYPYACAPYGYYGPSWFANGVFIGTGPWYHRAWAYRPYYRPYYRDDDGYRGYGYDRHDYDRDRDWDRDRDRDRHWDRDDFRGRGDYHENGHGGHWDNGWHGRH